MPSIRIGFSTDFNLTGEQIGIGTTNPTARLDVAGQIRSDDSAGSGGVSTVTRYAGFLDEAQGLGNNVSIAETTKGNLNSLSGEIKISGEVTVTEDTKLTGGRLDSLTVTGKFDLPHGGSEDREDTPEKGSTRFNQDLGQLEFYTGYEWRTVGSIADSSGRGRGVFGGGWDSTNNTSLLHTLQIHTLGNSEFFGDLSIARRNPGGRVSSSIRGIFSGGFNTAPGTDRIDYITFSSTGTAADFGNLLTNGTYAIANAALSSSTRGIMSGGVAAPGVNQNVIQYIEIPTTGDAIDFGDLVGNSINGQAVASPTKGLFCGGGPNATSTIQSITISSRGDAVDVGDLTQAIFYGGCVTNGTRGIVGGGEYVPSPTFTHTSLLDYITISSAGNANEFGDLTTKRARIASVESITRGVFVGSVADGGSGTHDNTIDYITIASTGNAQDFGDLVNNNNIQVIGCSDSHGGLGGF
jgi:hypothetical protein